MKDDRESYYFRHYADSRNDPKIIRLLMKHGMEGYGIFWSILEMLRTAKDYQIEYAPDTIAHQLFNNCDTIKSICEHMSLFVVSDGKLYSPALRLFLLQRSEIYRQNQKSHRDSIQLSNNCDTIEQQLTPLKERKGKERRINKATDLHQSRFEQFWKRYPRKEGKAAALKSFVGSVNSEANWSDFKKATEIYLAKIEREHIEPQFIKQGSTFMNSWRDWLSYEETNNGSPINMFPEQ